MLILRKLPAKAYEPTMKILSLIWLPAVIILVALIVGGLAWFYFVRSIDIPWDDRSPHKRKDSR